MTLYDSRGTHHVIKCTGPSPSVNTPTRNYHSRACARDYIGARERGYLLDRDDARGLLFVTPACACQFTALEVVNCPLCMQSIPGVNAFFSDTLLYNSLPALSKRAAVYLTDVSNNEGLVLYPIYCR